MNLVTPASTNPSPASVDDILRDAASCSQGALNAVGQTAQAGLNAYNTMANAFSNPQNVPGQQNFNPYSANPGYVMPQQVPYAYAENINNGYGYMPYLNTMNPQMVQGYPGFADPDYGNPNPSVGFGYGGRL